MSEPTLIDRRIARLERELAESQQYATGLEQDVVRLARQLDETRGRLVVTIAQLRADLAEAREMLTDLRQALRLASQVEHDLKLRMQIWDTDTPLSRMRDQKLNQERPR